PVLDVLIAGAIVGGAFHLLVAGERREPAAQGVFLKPGHEHLGQFTDAGFVVWIANVDDLPVTNPFGIFNDAVEAFDPFSDVGEAAFLAAAINQEDGVALNQVEDELGNGPGTADAGGVQAVQFGSHPIERAEEREGQMLLLAVSPDDPVEQLFDAGINPALHPDGAQHQLGMVFIELRFVAHAVHLGGRWEDDAFAEFHAVADDAEILLEIQLEDAERIARVFDGGGNGDQRDDHIALAHVILDPFAMNGNVALVKMEARPVEQVIDVVGAEIRAVDFVAWILEQPLRQRAADETVDSENEHLLRAARFQPRAGL